MKPDRVRKAAPDRTVTRALGGALTDVVGFTPPHSVELEHRVLGSLMDPCLVDAWPLAQASKIRVKAFYVPAHGLILQAISDMRARGMVVDLGTLTDELKLHGQFDDVGGFSMLTALARAAAPTSLHLRQDLERLRLLWEQRNTLDLCADMREAVVQFDSREKFAEQLSAIGQRLIRFGRTEASMTLQEHIEEVERDVERRITGTEDRSGWVFTGLPTFDERLKPLNSAKLDGLVVVGGGSGHGKSALMRQLAWNCLKTGGSVLFYTLETDLESLVEQMVSTVAQVDLEKLPDYAQLYPERMAVFRAECRWLREEIAGKRLWLVEHGEGTQMATVEDMEAHYRAHSNLHGHPTMVVVDYLQILETKKKTQSREQTVATVSHAIKRLKLDAGNCWLVGAQLNETGLASMRQPQRDPRTGKITKHNLPGAGALRESQAIFHDADRVIMLYCPPEDCRGNDNWGPNTLHPEIWLWQCKRKKGAIGIVRCWFNKRFTHFRELSRGEVEGDGAAPGGGGQTPPEAPGRPGTKAAFLEQQRRKEGR